MTSFINMNEMNEEYGFSYFNFDDTHKIPSIEQESINSMIEWHDNITQLNVESIVPNARHFGILRISTPKIPISTTPLAILLNIDGSSSMDEIGSDKLTKINHIKHTLKNMIHVLIDKITETPDICIYISILLFTHDVTNLLQRIKTEKQFEHFKDDFILLNHQSMYLILDEIDRIRPWGCTNIEISLKTAKTKINDFMTKNPNFRIAHIQLTDGQATAGKKRAKELLPYVDTKYRNIFVGYGEDHDGRLLASLGEIYPTCDYRFIDNIERTGMVYGEIMYHLLYPYNNLPILIKMSPGTKIYNWKTNQWSSTLIIPPLSSDTEKVFQIIIDDTYVSKEEVWADLYYTNNILVPIETAITLPSLITLPIKISQENTEGDLRSPNEEDLNQEEESGTKLPVNLTKYLLRQITQECLYLVRNYEINKADTDTNIENTLDPNFEGGSSTGEVSSEEATHSVSPLPNSSVDLRSPSELVIERLSALRPPRLIRGTNNVSSYQSTMITINELKCTLTSNIKLLQYYRDEQLIIEDDVLFIQTLIDDLQTAFTNLGSRQSFMYTTARQTSQGSQHTYSPYNTRYNNTNTFDLYNHPTEHNQRQTSYINHDILDMMTQVQGVDNSMYVSNSSGSESTTFRVSSGKGAVSLCYTNSEGDRRSPDEFEEANVPSSPLSDVENDIPNFSGCKAPFEVSSEEAGSPLPNSSGDRRSPSDLVEQRLSAHWPDSYDNLSHEPVVYNTHAHIPFPEMSPRIRTDSIHL